MKKVLLMLVACAAMTACQQKGKTAEAMDNVDSTETMDSLRFQGEVPAADGPGIRYEVALANDTTNGFSMTRTYLEAENGKDKAESFTGKAEKIEKEVDGTKETAYKFVLGDNDAEYFLVVNDSTLRMVNDELEEAASKLNYDLKRVK